MKKNPIALQKKLFLSKETIARLNSHAQLHVRGGNLVEGPVDTSFDYRRCTTIEEFRLSLEIQCRETEKSGGLRNASFFCRNLSDRHIACCLDR